MFTQSLAAVAGLGILFSGRFGIKLKPKHFRPDFSFYKRAFLLGLPASIEQTTRGFGLTVMTFLVASFGTVTIAAYGIGFNVLSFVIIPAMGLSMATSALVGQNIGAGNIARATEIATLSATISFTSLTVMGGIVYVGAAPIVRFFVPSDANVLAAGGVFPPNRRPLVRLHRPSACADRCLPGIGQHAGHHGARPRLTVGAAIPNRVRSIVSYRPWQPWDLVGVFLRRTS